MRRAGPLVLVLTAVGCAGPVAPAPVPVYPVAGKLIVSDRPAGGAKLMFHPVSKGDAPLYPVGVTAADGTFHLTTRAPGDGAPEGEYVVTMIWPHDGLVLDECACIDLQTHDRLCGLYADPATSRLRATVRPERTEITLYATVGGRGWNLPRLKDAVKPPDPRANELRDRY